MPPMFGKDCYTSTIKKVLGEKKQFKLMAKYVNPTLFGIHTQTSIFKAYLYRIVGRVPLDIPTMVAVHQHFFWMRFPMKISSISAGFSPQRDRQIFPRCHL